jgi:hypothetical protein
VTEVIEIEAQVHRPEAYKHMDKHKKCIERKNFMHAKESKALTVTHEGHHVDSPEGPGRAELVRFAYFAVHSKGENIARKPSFSAMMVHIQTTK